MANLEKNSIQKELARLRKIAERIFMPKERKNDSQFILQPVRNRPADKYKK